MTDDDLDECWADVKAPPLVRTYHGVRSSLGNCRVTVTVGTGRPKPLPVCLNIVKHSPSGFEWAYEGSGPAQLALAILMDTLGKDHQERAVRLHQDFKRAVVAKMPKEQWDLTNREVIAILNQLEGPGKGGDRGG